MTSAINPLYPVEGTPTTESVRDNFLAAKTEIEALQTDKQDTLESGVTIKTIAGKNPLGSGNLAITKEDVGLPNVDNTSDINKPVSTAQEGAIMSAAGSALTAANTYTDDELAAHVAADNPHEQYALATYNGNTLIGFKNKDGTEASVGGVKTSSITASRSTSSTDDQTIAANNTSNNYTITVSADTIANGLILQQLSTGTVTVAAGAGVTFIGSTLATSSAGKQIVINPTPIANTFNVKVA